LCFDQINVAFVSRRDFFQKHFFLNITNPKHGMVVNVHERIKIFLIIYQEWQRSRRDYPLLCPLWPPCLCPWYLAY